MPDAHDPSKKHRPTMLTTDLALRFDPAYEKVSRNFYEHPEQFAAAFAKAWFKLLHRDMGPVTRYLGPWVPEPQLWQDPVPAVDHELVGDADVAALKAKVLDSGLSVSQLVRTAWASAAIVPRHRHARRGQRRADPPRAAARLGGQRPGRAGHGAADPRGDPAGLQRKSGAKISLADLIVLAGGAAVEKAAKDAGHRRDGAVHAGSDRRLAGGHRRRDVLGARAAGGRLPQLPARGREAASRRPCCWTAPTCCG